MDKPDRPEKKRTRGKGASRSREPWSPPLLGRGKRGTPKSSLGREVRQVTLGHTASTVLAAAGRARVPPPWVIPGIRGGHADNRLASTWRLGLGKPLEGRGGPKMSLHLRTQPPTGTGLSAAHPKSTPSFGLCVLGFYFSFLRMVLAGISSLRDRTVH